MKRLLRIILIIPITLLYILLSSNNIKYSEEIIINASIDTVAYLFDNPYNMKEYMYGIESYTILDGNIREVGAKAELVVAFIEDDVVKHKNKMIEETITNNLPEEKKIRYTSNRGYNLEAMIVTNKLIKISDNKTKLITEREFEFKGYMKVMGFFMPSAFKQQSRVYLKKFKEFVENH